jgi:hypothetical protein
MRAATAALLLVWGVAAGQGPTRTFTVVVLPAPIRDSMSAVWTENNRHWNELSDMNTLTQMLGTGKPTQREYLGCLTGYAARDTLWVRHIVPAADLKQLQFAVAGDCSSVAEVVGTWHTHPYRADPAGHALKERGLSALDLKTFAAARDLVTMVMWDADSLDLATKRPEGGVRHPAPYIVR